MDYVWNPTPRRMPSKRQILEHWSDVIEGVTSSNYACFKCGSKDGLERSHIIPRCYGGDDNVSNIHLLCHFCHRIAEYWLGADKLQKDEFLHVYNDWIGIGQPTREHDPHKQPSSSETQDATP